MDAQPRQRETSARAPGLLDARPANDTRLTAVALSPRSAQAPAIRATVAPVRTAFRPSHVSTYSVTCSRCGVRDSLHGLTVERDGQRYPACAGCWRRDRTAVPDPVAPLSFEVKAARADAFDVRVLAALVRNPGATLRQVSVALDLIGDDAAWDDWSALERRVRHSLMRYVATGRARRRRRDGQRVRFWATP